MASDEFDIPESSSSGGSSGGGRRLTWLLVGLLLGIAGTILVPRYLGPHLPLVRDPGVEVEGTVLEKQRDEGQLLLTLDSERGAMLATFRDRVPELDLLISRGDRVTVAVAEYRPFARDPRLLGVRKGDWTGVGEAEASPADTASRGTGARSGPAGTDTSTADPDTGAGGATPGDTAAPAAGDSVPGGG